MNPLLQPTYELELIQLIEQYGAAAVLEAIEQIANGFCLNEREAA